jgi:hypothetical protein
MIESEYKHFVENYFDMYPKHALLKTLSVLGEEYVLKWYVRHKESFENCVNSGGLPKDFKKINEAIKYYIEEEPELLNYFLDTLYLSNYKRMKVVEILRPNFKKEFKNSKYTKKVISQMKKFGIDYEKLNDYSMVYSSRNLLPYGRDLRWKIFEEVNKNESLKLKYFGNSGNLIEKIVDMKPKHAISIAKELGIDDTIFHYDNNYLIEFNPWERNPKRDIFIGNRADSCIAVGGGNFDKIFKFLRDPGTTMIEIRFNKEFIAYSRIFPAIYNGEKLLYLDYYHINSRYEKHDKMIKEYLVSMLMLHGKKCGFGWLCSGGFELYHHDYSHEKAYENLISEMNENIKKFGYSKERLIGNSTLGDYPYVGYLIRLT